MPVVEFPNDKQTRLFRRIFDLRVLIIVTMIVLVVAALAQNPIKPPSPLSPTPPVPAASVDQHLLYTFNVDGSLDEAAPMSATKSPYWWLDSGGQLFIADGVGETI